MDLDVTRWVIHAVFTEGNRNYYQATCKLCDERVERIRTDQLAKRQCMCTRKSRGKPLNEGDRFGKLTVVCRSYSNTKNVYYTVLCDCGTTKDLQASQLRSGSTSSCGCTLEAKRGSKRETHGLTKTKEYKIWASIVNRTSFPHQSTRKWYFDKGVKMSEEWRSSFTRFLEDMGECPDGYSIDRIDPDGDYCKENCRWASLEMQSINKGVFSNNTSGTTGVHETKNGTFQAYIYVNYKRKHLGTFKTKEEAINARKTAEQKYWGDINE